MGRLPAWPSLSLMGSLLKVSRQNVGRALKPSLLCGLFETRHITAGSIREITAEWSLTAESGLSSALPSWS